MKKEIDRLSWVGLLLLFLFFLLIFSRTDAQPDNARKKHKDSHHDCAGNCFSAELLTAVAGEGGCTDFEMRVSHDGDCRYELSHFVVDIPCGQVTNVSNSGDYAQKIGKEPTTGLTGLKIDNIGNFGKTGPNFFTVKFSWCNNGSCVSPSDCWQPFVAFKAARCVDYDTVSFTCDSIPPPTLRVNIQTTNVSCAGKSDGGLSANVEGGVEPYTFEWSTGCTSSSVQNLPVGTYTVTITDTDGNTVTVSEEIVATSNIVLSASTVNPLCGSQSNGSIDLTVTGGVEPYSYDWSNGAASQDIANLAGGAYRITVTDSIGCTREATFQIFSPVISVIAQLTHPGCTQANGQIDITVSGGVAPYEFQWSTGALTEDITNAGAGSYSVVVTDANGCSRFVLFTLRDNNTLRISFVVTPTTCLDNGTGAIDVTVTGGTAPYSYLWVNGATTEDLTGLSSGIQRLTVTDAVGCTANAIISVFRQSFQVTSQTVPPTCSGDANGSISLTPNGVAPYTYLWSTGATTSSISSLASGLYSVTVTDATGCSQFLSFFISDPVINAFATVDNPQCGAEGAFAINLLVSGGTAPYSFLWSNGATTEDISGLNSGAYSVTITDANGCSKIVDVVVAPVVIDWSCLISPLGGNPRCGSSGNPLSTSVTGADSYAWSVQSDNDQWTITSGQNSPSILFTAGGEGGSATFTLAVTKAGCTQTCSLTMSGCSPLNTCGGDPVMELPIGPGGGEPIPNQPTTKNSVRSDFRLAAYPNPVIDKLSISWTAETDEYVQLELVDLYGKRVAELYAGFVHAGEIYRVELNAGGLTERLYIYQYTSASRTVHGKVLRR